MNLLLAQQVTIRKPGLPLNFGIGAFSATVFKTILHFVSRFRSKTSHASPSHHIAHNQKGYWPFSQTNNAVRERRFLKEKVLIRRETHEGLLLL